jgi:hypothetical protein
MKYTEVKGEFNTVIVRENEDGTVTFIPSDPANSDYQQYLKSLDEASTL